VLEKGRLLHSGTHAELVRLPGPYRETASLQLMDLTEEPATERSVLPMSTLSREPDPGYART